MGGVGALVVAVAAGGAWAVTRGHQPPAASVDQAVRNYRATSTTRGSSRVGDGPAPGVYTATGTGSEKLSIQANATTMGPTMPVTVTGDGSRCWQFRIAYTTDHWQSWRYCLQGNRLLDLGGAVHQRFDFTVFHYDSDVQSVCDPADEVLHLGAEPGDRWAQSCSSGSGSSASHQAGTATYLGVARLKVGNRSVTTDHVRWTRDTTGAQHGTSRDEYWFATDTYLPVRHVWTLAATTPGPGGASVTYDETGEWDLATLQPRS